MGTTSSWIPNVHPLLVHFPIALLFTAMAIELTGLLLKKYPQAGFIADVLIWSGTIFGLVTLFSGLQAADSVTIPDATKAAVEDHQLIAIITISFFILYSIVRIFHYRNRNKLKPALMITILILGCMVYLEYINQEKREQCLFINMALVLANNFLKRKN